MWISVTRSNFTLFFFKASCNANPEAERIFARSSSLYFKTYFCSSQIHQLTIMYHFEHANHDIPLNFLFQNLCYSFWVHKIRISNIFYISVTLKIFFFFFSVNISLNFSQTSVYSWKNLHVLKNPYLNFSSEFCW